jgi:hypothetical protein
LTWALLWSVLFVVALSGFALVSLAIAVKGVGEIRELFRGLGARRSGPPPEE